MAREASEHLGTTLPRCRVLLRYARAPSKHVPSSPSAGVTLWFEVLPHGGDGRERRALPGACQSASWQCCPRVASTATQPACGAATSRSPL